MEIVQADISHIGTLVQLRRDFRKEIYGNEAVISAPVVAALGEYYTRHMADGSFLGLLGFVEGEIVSTLSVSVYDRVPSEKTPNGRQGTVYNVYTYPPHRGKGYATALLQRAVAWAKAGGVTAMDLTATQLGAPVYQEIGFETEDVAYMTLHLGREAENE